MQQSNVHSVCLSLLSVTSYVVLIMLLCAVTGADLPSDGGLEVQCVGATGGGQQDPEEHV